MSDKPLAVVLTSGGLDSCVTAAVAALDHTLALMHATYGQRTAARERQAFEQIADHFQVPPKHRLVLDIGFLAAIGGSALTDVQIDIPEGAPGAGIPVTYVPFRNAHLLASGVSWAEVLHARAIYIGAVEEDSSGYPDCREVFIKAFERVVQLGTAAGTQLTVHTPLIHSSKAQIVARGVALNAPLHLTWSCYQREQRACGRCESCYLRLKGFREAGLVDPIPYEVPG